MRQPCAVVLLAAVLLLSPAAAFPQTKPSDAVAKTLTPPLHFTCDEFLRGLDSRPLQGAQRLTFTLFRGGDAWTPDSGLLLYGETAEVEVSNGQMTHAVGTGSPTFGQLTASLLASSGQTAGPEQILWLQIAVAGDAPQTVLPRTRLHSAPFAAAAATAATASDSQRLGGLPADAYAKKTDLEKAAKALVRLAGTGYNSFIGGGINNNAGGEHSTIGAGVGNTASGYGSSILGGFLHQATRSFASVGGGYTNLATGDFATVAGGNRNQASALLATVGGGDRNAAQGPGSTIAGGIFNWVTRCYSFIGGGQQNQATGNYSVVPGGLLNSATGDYSFAAGRRAKAVTTGSFTWADSQDADYRSPLEDSASFRARNGLYVDASTPFSGLQVQNQGTGYGIFATAVSGVGGSFFSSTNVGVLSSSLGFEPAGRFISTRGYGVEGVSNGPAQAGVRGHGQSADGIGVLALGGFGTNPVGIYASSGTGYAGRFFGRVHVQGTLSKSAGGFKIDHPLDPANKYLSHSFVESPDMKNVYDGTVILGGDGRATVELPSYFEALNRDFRYQLTPIGAQASLYIVEEIRDNRFVIGGGPAGLKVSWQVTGIRQDAYARAHPIVVEEEKPAAEKGTWLHPAEHGQPESKNVSAHMPKGGGEAEAVSPGN